MKFPMSIPLCVMNTRVIWVLLMTCLVFLPFIFTPPPYLYLLTSNAILTGSFAVMVAFWPAARIVLTTRCKKVSYVDLLSLGIFLVFMALTLILGYNVILQFLRLVPITIEDVAAVYYLPQSLFRFVGLIGAMLHLAARPVFKGQMPTVQNVVHVTIAAMAGVLLTLIQIYYLMP